MAQEQKPVVFLALPRRPGEGGCDGQLTSLWNMGGGFHFYDFRAQPMSLLTTNFNTLWCAARNLRTAHLLGRKAHAAGTPRAANPYAKEDYGRSWDEGWDEADGKPGPGPITDFAMMHGDVLPEPGRWLQDLLEIKYARNLDILATVIPLKDECGQTSTGVMNWRTKQIRKLSLRECMALPETFTAADARADLLLINTGLWVADLTRPWARKVCFRIYDTILEDADGMTKATAVGEDWLLGMDAHRLGLKVAVTRKVKINHFGVFKYPNSCDWGTHEGEGETGTPWCIEPPFHWQYEAQTGSAYGTDGQAAKAVA